MGPRGRVALRQVGVERLAPTGEVLGALAGGEHDREAQILGQQLAAALGLGAVDDLVHAAQDGRHAVTRATTSSTTSRLTTFSDGVRGKSSKTSTDSGQVYLATPSPSRNSCSSLSVGAAKPSRTMIAAHARSPRRSSGSGTIATSRIAGWRRRIGSPSARPARPPRPRGGVFSR